MRGFTAVGHGGPMQPAPPDAVRRFDSAVIFVRALVVAAVVGGASGGGSYLVIAPDCATSQEWLCGLTEALVALAVGTIMGLATFVWDTVRQVRRRVPEPQRGRMLLVVLVAYPAGITLVWLALGLLAALG